MKNKGVLYFIVIVTVIISLVTFFKFQRQKKLKNPVLTDISTEPDILISSADYYLREDQRLIAISYLEDAIKTMRLLEKGGDSLSNSSIEHAIDDLKVVEEHIKSNEIDYNFMYQAYADAMNSLAIASLKISENLILQGNEEKAESTLKFAMTHLQNSITFAKGKQKEDEVQIASKLQKIIKEHELQDIKDIDEVMIKIDSVVKHHIIK